LFVASPDYNKAISTGMTCYDAQDIKYEFRHDGKNVFVNETYVEKIKKIDEGIYVYQFFENGMRRDTIINFINHIVLWVGEDMTVNCLGLQEVNV
jgi:hypothetical protein